MQQGARPHSKPSQHITSRHHTVNTSYHTHVAGTAGESMRSEVLAKIEKWQEPPPAKTVKPLPAPDAEKKKRRGGKRYR